MSYDPSYPNSPPPASQQLAYSAYVRGGKPGILTAVGIVSILVGLLGALFSLSVIAQAVMFGILFPRMAATVPTAPPAGVAPAPVPTTAPTPATPPTSPPPPPGVILPPSAALAGAVYVSGSTTAPTTAPAGTGTTTTTTTPPAPPPITFSLNIDRVTMVSMLADGIINFALAVFVFVLGIMTLTGSPRARRGHLLWAWLKLPAIALSFVSTMGMTQSMARSVMTMPTPTGTPVPTASGAFMNTMAIIQATMYAVFALIYPIAILIVMRTKRVKEYYEAGAGSGLG